MLNLPINEGQGSTAHDSSGYGNHGTIYGATWTKGSYGYGLYFDGTDDYVDCGNDSSLDITDEITIELWINSDTEKSLIIGKGGNYWTAKYTIYYISQGAFEFSIYTDETGHSRLGDGVPSVSPNVWHHIVGTYTNGSQKIYIDGVMTNEKTATGSIETNSSDIYIAQGYIDEWVYFNGTIDEVRIYDRAWTADEVLSYYNATKGRFGL